MRRARTIEIAFEPVNARKRPLFHHVQEKALGQVLGIIRRMPAALRKNVERIPIEPAQLAQSGLPTLRRTLRRPHDDRPARGVKARRALRRRTMVAFHKEFRVSPTIAGESMYRNKIPETLKSPCLCARSGDSRRWRSLMPSAGGSRLTVHRVVRNRATPKLLKGVEELHTYVERNQEFVPNYGERYRNGERIASGFVESAINQVVSKRMVKKQQMGWSQRGAHLLLQIRTRVLDEEWENTFRRWYPDFHPQGQAKKSA
jgi:hypothetical protein